MVTLSTTADTFTSAELKRVKVGGDRCYCLLSRDQKWASFESRRGPTREAWSALGFADTLLSAHVLPVSRKEAQRSHVREFPSVACLSRGCHCRQGFPWSRLEKTVSSGSSRLGERGYHDYLAVRCGPRVAELRLHPHHHSPQKVAIPLIHLSWRSPGVESCRGGRGQGETPSLIGWFDAGNRRRIF